MPKLPNDLLGELLGLAKSGPSKGPHAQSYPQDAYRVTRSAERPVAESPHRWWFKDAEAAESYGKVIKTHLTAKPDEELGAPATLKEGTATIPGKLNTKDFPEIDANGADWMNLPLSSIKDVTIKAWLKHRLHLKGNDDFYVTTDDVANAVGALNLPGVRIRNVRDSGDAITDQFFVNHLNRRRGRFAKFEDPSALDLLGGAAGLGLSGAALFKKDES